MELVRKTPPIRNVAMADMLKSVVGDVATVSLRVYGSRNQDGSTTFRDVTMSVTDFERLKNNYYFIYYNSVSYKIARINQETKKQSFLWGDIMKPPKGFQVDHINHDIFDNTRSNLRLATPSQNMTNLAGPKSNNKLGVLGIFVSKKNGRFCANIKKEGKLYRASFKTLQEAVSWRQKMAKQLHGEFAATNLFRKVS